MASYNSILRHVTMRDIKRNTKKIQEQKILEIKCIEEKKNAEILELLRSSINPKLSNWRRELEEGMTTSDLGMINLPAEKGDLQSNSVGSSSAYTEIRNGSVSGSGVDLDFSGSPEVGNTHTRWAEFRPTNAIKFDTFVTNVTVGSGPDQWFEPREHGGSPTHVFPGGFRVVMYSKSQENNLSSRTSFELSSGTNTITIPSHLRVSDLVIYYIGIANSDPLNGGVTGTHTVSSASFQRRSPMNVFVSLDNPEAAAFIRDTLGNQNLSPEQKKKKLEEMLGASAEYVIKMFGEGAFTGASEISDVQVQQSFTQIASADWPSIKTHSTIDDIIKAPLPPGSGFRGKYDQFGREIDPKTGFPLKKVQRNQTTQVAHYEPEGEVIVEKKLKSPKSLLDKIPGYYDGKPSPLGFPIEEPPKLKNGMHPDLVDGKKVANRYNRLDPISAKAMPLTGNSYIDKKVKAARNKLK